jgi:trimeric autotransporter adhesin
VTSPLPTGVTASFAPSSTAAGSVLTLGASYSAPAGNFPLTISGTSNGRTVTTTIPLNVQAVSAMPTTTALTLAPEESTLAAGQSFTLTATVTQAGGAAAPTGDIVFTIGNQTVAPSGSGSLDLCAAYQGGAGFAASASAIMDEAIAAPTPAGFALAATSLNIAPGATTGNTSTITISSAGGFTGNVRLSAAIASAPAGAASLPQLSFGGTTPVALDSSTANALLTVSSTAGSTASAQSTREGFGLYSGGAALACVLLIGVPRRRTWGALLGMVVLLFALAGGMTACSGGSLVATGRTAGSASTGTTAGTYVIAITGTSGATTATANITLTVE